MEKKKHRNESWVDPGIVEALFKKNNMTYKYTIFLATLVFPNVRGRCDGEVRMERDSGLR